MFLYSVRQCAPKYRNPIADLLAARRRERRNSCPLLPRETDEAASARGVPDGAGGGGVLLSEDGSLAGFMLPRREENIVWGNAAVLDVDRWALPRDIAAPEAARLYGTAFGPLMKEVFEHRVYCPSYDLKALDTWFHLGFGIEQVYAAAYITEMETDCPDIGGLVIRRAAPGDGDILSSLSPLIARAQAGPPVWAGAPSSYLDDIRAGFRDLAGEEDGIVLMAFVGEKAAGYQAWFPVPGDPEGSPSERRIELTVGASVPGMRGRGVGRALTARGAREALAAGYTTCFTDWRTANPHSSAFWPARGFKPCMYRLVRRFLPQTYENIGVEGVY